MPWLSSFSAVPESNLEVVCLIMWNTLVQMRHLQAKQDAIIQKLMERQAAIHRQQIQEREVSLQTCLEHDTVSAIMYKKLHIRDNETRQDNESQGRVTT